MYDSGLVVLNLLLGLYNIYMQPSTTDYDDNVKVDVNIISDIVLLLIILWIPWAANAHGHLFWGSITHLQARYYHSWI